MKHDPSIPPPPFGLAYALGRKSAPLFFKTQWIMKSLTGTDSEKIAAEFQMGHLLAQAYEEKVFAIENNRLSTLANQLVSSLRNKERTFTFKCDQSGILNALAFPGGFIYLSESLFDHCGEDLDAIAFVLAHEIAHIIHGDANKRFLTKTVITGLSRVSARGMNPALQHLLGHLVQQGYSRDQEYRADRFAVALTTAAGFDPAGGCRLFSILRNHEKEAHSLEPYFSSHPSLSDRIDRITQRMKAL
jgi:predicted Zn-dependent protease